MQKSKLTDAEILALFKTDTRIGKIAELAGVSRQAVWNALHRTGEYDNRHGSEERICRFCSEKYRVWRHRVKSAGEGFGYCSVQCFHADRSLSGEYSKNGGALARMNNEVTPCEISDRQLGRKAAKALRDAGVKLKPGQVVHHKDGDRTNFAIDNLIVFKNQSEHMKYHHSLRGKVQKLRAGNFSENVFLEVK